MYNKCKTLSNYFQYFPTYMLAHGRWFSPGTPASSTTKTGRHDIAESGVKHQKTNITYILYQLIIVSELKKLFFASLSR